MNVAAISRTSGAMTCDGKPCPSWVMYWPVFLSALSGLYLSQTLSHRSVLKDPTHLRSENGVRDKVRHCLLYEEMKQGVISCGYAPAKIGFRCTRRWTHQAFSEVEKVLRIDRHFPVTSPDLVLKRCPQPNIRPAADLMAVESLPDLRGQLGCSPPELRLRDEPVRLRIRPPRPQTPLPNRWPARNPSSLPMEGTRRFGVPPPPAWLRPVLVDRLSGFQVFWRRPRWHCRTAPALQACRQAPELPPPESLALRLAIPLGDQGPVPGNQPR